MDNTEGIMFAYGLVYIWTVAFCTWLFIIHPFVILPIMNKFKKRPFYIYGTCNNRIARKHSITKNVQFIIWKAGQQGRKKDCWINFDSSWWDGFKENNHKINNQG